MKSEQYALHASIEERHWWFLARRTIMRRLVERVVPPTGQAIVDLGCGTGANIASLARAHSCVGIDASPEAIAYAEKRYAGHPGSDLRFLCGSAPGSLDATSRDADLFLLMDVLEHAADDAGYLAALWAAIRPGAQVLITVPADPSLWSEHDVSFGHHRRYERASLAGLWAGLPAATRLLSHYNARLHPLIKAARVLNRWRGRTSGEAGTDFSMPAAPVNRALELVFAGEAERLVRAVDAAPGAGYSRGVSLIAILRREP
jgi:SAM-dependent methyltransferase